MRIKFITNRENKDNDFRNEIIRHLTKSCDDEVRRVLQTIKNRTEERNMVKFGKCKYRINERLMDRLVRETVRIIDAMDSEKQCSFDKHPQHHDLINNNARNVFSQGLTAVALKRASGFNMHGKRNRAINKNLIIRHALDATKINIGITS